MKYLTLWALLCILFGCGGTSQEEPPKKPSKIIFGYLQYEQLPEYQIPWDQLTHLSIAFGRTTEEGGLADAANIEKLLPIFREGQKKGVKVLLSAGGGGNKTIMAGVLLNDTYRNRFKKELLKAVEDWGFDGLDIDYEHWAGGPEGYGEGDKEKVALLENFYKELRTELPKGKLLTAAVSADYPEWNGGWGNYNVYTNSMFEYLDLVNIMVYDFTGGWKSSKVAQHASMEHFRMAAKRWSEIRGVPKEKIILGVPFYGVHFVSAETPVGATHMPYKEILTNYPNEQATEKDEIGLLFYNGMPYCGASYKAGKLPDPHTSKRLRIKANPHFPHKSGLSHYKVRLPDRQTTVRPAAAFEIRTVFLWWMRYRNIAGINLRLQRSLHPSLHETQLRSRSMRRSLPAAISGRSSPALPTPYHVHTPGKCPYIVRTAFSA